MTDCWIYVPLAGYQRFEKVVRGKIVDVAPHLPGTFVVHRRWTWIGIDRKWWQISHVETGCEIVVPKAKTMLEAEQSARNILSQITPQKYHAAVWKKPAWTRQ